MLQRGRPEIGVHNMARLLVQVADPLSELSGIRHCRREENHLDSRWQEYDALLPHDSSLSILQRTKDKEIAIYENVETLNLGSSNPIFQAHVLY